jgi:hypothetical protein
LEAASQTFLPTPGVAGDGTVAVTWYDFDGQHETPGTPLTYLWLGRSRDGGKTWTTTRLDGPFGLRSAPRSGLGAFIGDYEGMAGLPNAFGALYVLAQPRSGKLPAAVFFKAVASR